MAVYISLLRGINVGGKHSISMSELTNIYRQAHCTNVTTYIQSGNVVFETNLAMDVSLSAADIASEIEAKILAAFGMNIRVIMRTPDELRKSAEYNPFLAEPDIDLKKLHVTFLSDFPAPEHVRAISELSFPPDHCKLLGREVFVHCPDGYGRTKLTNALFENVLRVPATTRNWNTVRALLKIADRYPQL